MHTPLHSKNDQLKSTGLLDEFMYSGKYIFVYLLLKVRISSKCSFDVVMTIMIGGYCAYADISIFRAIE